MFPCPRSCLRIWSRKMDFLQSRPALACSSPNTPDDDKLSSYLNRQPLCAAECEETKYNKEPVNMPQKVFLFTAFDPT